MRTVEKIIVNFGDQDVFDCDKRKRFEAVLHGLILGYGGLSRDEQEEADKELIDLGLLKHEVYGRVKR